MIERFETDDPYDARLASGATGLLHAFNRAGVLTAADVHVAARVADLTGSLSTGILSLLVTLPLAVAAAAAAYRLVPGAEATRAQRAREAGEPI